VSGYVKASAGIFHADDYSGGLIAGRANVVNYVYQNTTGRIFSYDGASYYDLAIGDWNGGNPNIMLKKGGKVGIGIGNPLYDLDVSGTMRVSGDTVYTSTNPTAITLNRLSSNTNVNILYTNTSGGKVYAGGANVNPNAGLFAIGSSADLSAQRVFAVDAYTGEVTGTMVSTSGAGNSLVKTSGTGHVTAYSLSTTSTITTNGQFYTKGSRISSDGVLQITNSDNVPQGVKAATLEMTTLTGQGTRNLAVDSTGKVVTHDFSTPLNVESFDSAHANYVQTTNGFTYSLGSTAMKVFLVTLNGTEQEQGLHYTVNTSATPQTVTFPNYKLSSTDRVRVYYFTGVVQATSSSVASKGEVIGMRSDGNGAFITAGVKGNRSVNNKYRITGWKIIADNVGSVTVDVRLVTTYPSATTLAGTAKPVLTNGQFAEGSTSGWTTNVLNAGDIVQFAVEGSPTVTTFQIFLYLEIM
jgi:hypothetical protein